jgi:GNAT superfamily N-acetyltransferase
MSGIMKNFTIRPAQETDLPVIGRLGASLVEAHYRFDPQRFIEPMPGTTEGYAHFLGSQLKNNQAVILVAERDGEIAGYVYAGVEPHDWKELRARAGFIHDLVVVEHHRYGGIGSALLEAAAAWLRDKGVPRLVLWTAARNDGARRLFERLGFRPTMIEMTRELE